MRTINVISVNIEIIGNIIILIENPLELLIIELIIRILIGIRGSQKTREITTEETLDNLNQIIGIIGMNKEILGMNPKRIGMIIENLERLEMIIEIIENLEMNPERLEMNLERLEMIIENLEMNQERLETNLERLEMNQERLEMIIGLKQEKEKLREKLELNLENIENIENKETLGRSITVSREEKGVRGKKTEIELLN